MCTTPVNLADLQSLTFNAAEPRPDGAPLSHDALPLPLANTLASLATPTETSSLGDFLEDSLKDNFDGTTFSATNSNFLATLAAPSPSIALPMPSSFADALARPSGLEHALNLPGITEEAEDDEHDDDDWAMGGLFDWRADV